MDAVNAFFKRYDDPDKDHRYMVVSDLLEDVKKPTWKPPTSGDEVQKLCDIIVERLSDNSGDISALAVKWYASPSLPRRPVPSIMPP